MVPYPAALIHCLSLHPAGCLPSSGKVLGSTSAQMGEKGVEDLLLSPHLPPKANLQPTTAATLLRVGMLVENRTRKKDNPNPQTSPWSNFLNSQLHCRSGDGFFLSSKVKKRQSMLICPRILKRLRGECKGLSRVDQDTSLQLFSKQSGMQS